jgi:hypothetical protein
MIKIHVISDLFLGFNEFSTEEEKIPDADLVIINGNIGVFKRSMMYAETLCKKFPDIQFVYNYGKTEFASSAPKFVGEIEESMDIRKRANPTWPKNLHWSKEPQNIQLRNGKEVNVLSTYGYPKIHLCYVPWEDTIWHRDHIMKFSLDFPSHENASEAQWHKPRDSSNVFHGYCPVFASKEWINEQHQKEWKLVQDWELNSKGIKILVTHFNPYKDSRFENQETSPYLIHLENGHWIASDTEVNGTKFLGASLHSNPGRGPLARQKVITIDC